MTSHLSGKRCLVTGAAGFVGSALARRLVREGVEVIALVRPGTDLWRLQDIKSAVDLHELDLLNSNEVERVFRETKPDFVFNCAFPKGYPTSFTEQQSMLDFNVKVMSTLLHASEINPVKKFIQIGSSTEYGTSLNPYKETDLVKPDTIRGVGKLTSTLLCQLAASEDRVNTAILRLFNVYGPWEERRRLIPTTCNAILNRQPLKLTVPGYQHDWIHIDDVIEACLVAAVGTFPAGEIFNIGSGVQTPNEKVVELLEEIGQHSIPIESGAYPASSHDKTSWCADITKARQILCWKPLISLTLGLKNEFEFWKSYESGKKGGHDRP
jgi:nucleoside-diphosphate-sugar epimerase